MLVDCIYKRFDNSKSIPPAGLEPATFGLEVRRAIQLRHKGLAGKLIFRFIRNLPYKISAEELYDIFGKYGSVRQIRKGNTPRTNGTAFVVYDDIYDAKNALDHLSGFNVAGRYLVVLYYNPNRLNKRKDLDKEQEELDRVKTALNMND
ncbi:Splicing factor 3B subunit 6-like protein [Babesia sp. Xinjiang]|uniref:Splicing factor 3B subunit 6-like protein n=1 Tax=Babesia sp. Xinjiang TaxID=462227 RepID=UPI000A231D97|nr:Splicing factor 3B subunit 6-like protein [Babesia sp. Xinjiang]ORM41742.1 Splicing factor 3B subunit 6-like protein [Babesia sp. Xinjiang]